ARPTDSKRSTPGRDLDSVVQQATVYPAYNSCTGAGTTGERLPGTPLIDPQPDLAARHDLHVARVHPPWKTRMALDPRSFGQHRRGLDGVHYLDRMGIAHRDDFHPADDIRLPRRLDRQRPELRLGEAPRH